MTEPTEQTEPTTPPEPVTWIVAEHKSLESCIQYLAKGKWACWTTPPVKVGDVLASRMGSFTVKTVVAGDEPGQVFVTANVAGT